LRGKVQKLMLEGEKGGFIIRTMAEDASDADLQADVDYLRKTWSNITQLTKIKPAPSLLYQDLDLAQRVMRDFVNDETAASRSIRARTIKSCNSLPNCTHHRC
jgi:ribonuclease G